MTKKKIEQLQQELSTWKHLLDYVGQPHQRKIKTEIEIKILGLKEYIRKNNIIGK